MNLRDKLFQPFMKRQMPRGWRIAYTALAIGAAGLLIGSVWGSPLLLFQIGASTCIFGALGIGICCGCRYDKQTYLYSGGLVKDIAIGVVWLILAALWIGFPQ